MQKVGVPEKRVEFWNSEFCPRQEFCPRNSRLRQEVLRLDPGLA
jgi:hypothetical protein